MKSGEILYSSGKNDECYTPDYAVLPLLEFLPKDKDTVIWCPFDLEDSAFVRVFREHGYTVIASHISKGEDFYDYEPEKWDIIISNPPFTAKRKIFERALSFEKPFALLMTNTWLNDSAPKKLFMKKELQLLMFDKRIEYGGQPKNKITFSSSYFCWRFLPKQITIRNIKKD